VFLAAVIAVLSLAVNSGVIGGKGAASKPAATVTASPKGSPTPVGTARKSYRVRPGDTLGAIAIRFHTTASRLMTLNNLSSTTLRVGQRLKLPPPTQ
jgi:LysM repeat protein